MRSIRFNFLVLNLFYVTVNRCVVCHPVANTDLSANIRKYADTNATTIKTLQKQNPEIQGNFVPIHNPVKFKDIPDNAISSSNHGRGLLQHEHTGYGHDYDHHSYGYGHDDYHIHDLNNHNFGSNNFGHHSDYHGHHNGFDHHHDYHDHGQYNNHHQVDHGYHHKNYDHSLIAKALLLPIAGIAVLGAAAALVSNPVLLQLGVVSGRKRRDTDELTVPHTGDNNLRQWYIDANKYDHSKNNVAAIKHVKPIDNVNENESVAKKTHKKTNYKTSEPKKYYQIFLPRRTNKNNNYYNEQYEDSKLLRVPLILRN